MERAVREPLARTAVVVVNYNTRDALRACLTSLLGEGSDGLEIVVVDNASVDGSVAVHEEFPTVKMSVATTNMGFGRAANLGVSKTDRAMILTLNPDCLATPGAIATLAERLTADPGLGFAGPKILLEAGRVDHASLRADPDPLGAALYLTRLTRLFPKSARVNRYSLRHLDYDLQQELLAGTAGCLMFRAEAFHKVGGFDPDFFMYGEDLDLCRRVRETGYRGLYVPSATVVHAKGEATRQSSSRMLLEFHRAMWTYYRKHEAPRRPWPLNALVRLAIGGLAGLRLAVNALRRDKRVSAR